MDAFGENETTYEAHQSRPAGGEKRRAPSPYPENDVVALRGIFPDSTTNDKLSYLSGRRCQDTKDEEEEEGEVRGRRRWWEE